MRATENANFSHKITLESEIELRINGRSSIYILPCQQPGTGYHADLHAEYYVPGRRSASVTIRWDNTGRLDEPRMSHSSGGGDADDAELFTEILMHATILMRDWKDQGLRRAFNIIWTAVPWEAVDDRCSKSHWTEVQCDEWDEYNERIKREQKERQAEAFALEYDPHNLIMPLVYATLDRVKARKSLATRNNSHSRYALAGLVNGELSRQQERAFENGGIDALHTQILTNVMRVLEHDRSQAGEGIWQDANEERAAIFKRVQRKAELANEIAADKKRTESN